jgi:glycosyltransferase involved in cell wall biosynthesis
MRILQVCKTTEGAFWAVRQVQELVAQGLEVHVALPSPVGAAVDAWKNTGAVLHFLDCSLPLRQPLKMISASSGVRNLVRQIKPDLIHSHSVTTTLMLRLSLGRHHPIPRIFQVPGPLHLEQWPTRQMDILSAGKNDFWVASSAFTRGLYRSAGIPDQKLFLSYYSTDATQFSTERRGFLREKLQIPEHAFVVGNINLIYPPKRYLGHRVGLKCHEDVIEAISIAQRENDNIWGVLIGGTFAGSLKYEQHLNALAKCKGGGKILMPGKMSAQEVCQSWPDFDCAVHVPMSENCGGVVEPLLSGVPTIAGQVGGLPEVVQQGKTGITVPIRRPDLLAQSILEVMKNPVEYQKMATEGRSLASTLFNPKRCADEIVKIYQQLLSHQPASWIATLRSQ